MSKLYFKIITILWVFFHSYSLCCVSVVNILTSSLALSLFSVFFFVSFLYLVAARWCFFAISIIFLARAIFPGSPEICTWPISSLVLFKTSFVIPDTVTISLCFAPFNHISAGMYLCGIGNNSLVSICNRNWRVITLRSVPYINRNGNLFIMLLASVSLWYKKKTDRFDVLFVSCPFPYFCRLSLIQSMHSLLRPMSGPGFCIQALIGSGNYQSFLQVAV